MQVGAEKIEGFHKSRKTSRLPALGLISISAAVMAVNITMNIRNGQAPLDR
jgi:hypothetical protein